MVRVDTIEEIKEKREIEKGPAPQKFNALDYTKAIASTLALDGGSIGNLIKNGRIGWLKYTENMSAKDLAKVVATLVIFTAAGNLKPTKSGAISFARSKGNKITPSFKEKVEKAVEKYNEQPRGKQLEGLQKIRQSSVDALTSLLKDTKNKADRQTIKGELEAATKKLNETAERVKAEAKRNADEAAQVERIKEKVRQEKQKTKFEKESDKKVADYIKRKKAYDKKVAEILKNNPNAFKTKISEKTRVERRQEEMADLFRDPKDVAREQAEIARLKKEGLELEQEKGLLDSEAKQAQGKESGGSDSKADETKTEKPESERKGSKGVEPTKTSKKSGKSPSKAEGKTTKEQAEKQAKKETKERRDKETKDVLEKSEREDKPNFDDEPNETDPLIEKEQTTGEMIDSAIKEAEDINAASSKVSKAVTAGTAATIATEVVDKLTNKNDRNPRRTFEESDDEDTPGFTTETVKEGEPGTQSTEQPTQAPTVVKADITYVSNYKEQIVKNTNNIDELFQITIDLCEKVYEPETITEPDRFFYLESDGLNKFKVPILLHIRKRTLYIVFRGTDSFENIITDITTSESSIFNFEISTRSNFLYAHHPFDDVLNKKYSSIEFHLGMIKSVQESYGFLIKKIDELKNSINNIVLSGHSLGGGVAQLFSYIYTNSNQKITNERKIIYTITYGQPRILFNKPEYITLFNENVNNYIRTWNALDPVPYLPFKKQFDIEQMADSRIMSGYTHVGQSFDLTGNVVNNDVNLLLYEILKGSKEQIQLLLENKDLLLTSKLIQFILSPEYLQLSLYSFYNCLDSVNIKDDITEEQMNFIIKQLQSNIEKLNDYNLKCDLLSPFGLSEILKLNPIGDNVDDTNFSLSCITGCSIKMNKITKEAHATTYYHKKIDELINRQVDSGKPIFQTVKNEDGLFETSKEIDTNLFFKNVEGLYLGNFEDGNLIEF